MWFRAAWLMLVAALPALVPWWSCEASILGMDLWRPRSKREEVLVPDWILAEGCHVENCMDLTGREAPESDRNASHVKIRTPLLLSEPSPARIHFPGGKEVLISSTDLRNHLANMLCCLVNEVTHITERTARSQAMSSFYEGVISWIEELLVPALTAERYVSAEERGAVSRLAKDLAVLQQSRFVPAFYLDVTEARERAEERVHLQTIGLIVACAVGSVLLAFGLLFCVLMARGKKRAVARQQGEMEPLLEQMPAGTTSAEKLSGSGDGSATTQDHSLGRTVVSRSRLDAGAAADPAGYISDAGSAPGVMEVTVSIDDSCDQELIPTDSAPSSGSPRPSGSGALRPSGSGSPRPQGSVSARQGGSTSPIQSVVNSPRKSFSAR